MDHLFGEKAVTRPLILFNALFALQSGLDLLYLWGGANLPGGMSHAEYAHLRMLLHQRASADSGL